MEIAVVINIFVEVIKVKLNLLNKININEIISIFKIKVN